MAECNKSICQNCANSVGFCSWSGNLKPVKGWKANSHKVQMLSGEVKTGYEVLECPGYVPAERSGRVNPGEIWSDDEIDLLLIMRKQRLQCKTIAEQLRRSDKSVRDKISRLKKEGVIK